MPSHNPQPFVMIHETNRQNEIMRFCLLVADETSKSIKRNCPAIFFCKWELPTKEDTKPFLKKLLECIQIATKQVFKQTLHYSELTTEETKENQLDLMIGVGIKPDDFKKVLRQVILMANDSKKDVSGMDESNQTKEAEGSESTTNEGGSTKEDTEVVRET
jgi:hypothetical protein